MAVVRLSRTMIVIFAWLCTAFISAGIPAWKNVESPMHASIGALTTWARPLAIPMLAPMDIRVSTVSNGGATARL